MAGPRDYTLSTIKRLHTLSGNQCCNPSCKNPLIARDGISIISKICHIEAASTGGARYNPSMTDDERRHYSNLILCCDECHTIVDNPANESLYPVSLLKEWKVSHEGKQKNQLGLNSSLLNAAIDAIASVSFDDAKIPKESIKAFKIEDKITYNAIKRNKSLIEEYRIYQGKVNSLYDELEKQGSFKKENLLRNIRRIYLKVKGRYVKDSKNDIDIVKENADNIIENVENELLLLVEGHQGHPENVSFGVSVIMVDAFMRCKILEEPA